MKVIKKQIPEGVQYLSEWEEFDSLPKHEHYILAKEICGCGATEAFIRSHTPVIIAMPRKHLLYNKYSQHIGDNVFLYRFLNQKQYFSDKKPTEEEIKEFDRLLLDYVHSGGNKILMTFDSLDKATWLLLNEGLNPNQFQVVVDEFQQIIGDAPFKAAIEHRFYQALKRFDSVVYLSATPFLQSYLEMTDQFKGLNMIQLQWPDKSIRKADVNVIKLTKSIKDKCCEIIAKFKNGEMPYVFDGDSRIESKEAVFFLNDVRTIIKIIQNAKLKPEEVNILCAPRKENHDRIESLNKFKKDGESRFVRGNIPGKGEPHKMFTFCTSTVYIGADFYSENAYSYIFANPNIDSLTIDVGTDIQQIMGRQRNEHNPFRMKADLYYYLKKPMVTEGEIEDSIRTKRDETRKHIENLQNAVHKDCLMKSLEAMIEKGHKDQYCCLSDDGKGNLTVVENPLIAIAEKRAWDIANTIYSGDLSLIKALQNSVNIVRDVDTTDPDVRRLFNEWSKDGQFKRQAMMYCELREKMPQLFEQCTFIPKYFHDYYDALGREGMESLQWRNDYIREALAPTPQDLIPHDKIVEELKATFHEGEEYPKDQIKKVLTDIYLKLNIKGKPSACDIQRYFTIQEASRRIDGRKTATIRILSHWQKQITLFRHIADVKKPAENTDIDSVLNIIKDGAAYGLKNKITKLRAIKELQDFNKHKAYLPVATWNGVFNYRDSSGCELYSSFTALDFDKVADMKALKEWLKTIPCVYAIFTTPSGHGIKAIVLHDNRRKDQHQDLYAQLLKLLDCRESDASTSDLGRGNYLSYDAEVWVNPTPQAFHYEPSETIEIQQSKTHTVVKNNDGSPLLIEDDDSTCRFLNKLSTMIITDESIINMLRKNWTQQSLSRGRNNTALSYAGVLCKAGVEKRKAIDFIIELIPDLVQAEIKRAVEYAYAHNIFGSNRRRYIRRKR